MKIKYFILAWAWPIFSIFLFVCAMCLLIHEGAFHNFNRPQKAYYAMGLVIITFVNGWVAILISAHFKKPKKKECDHYFVPVGEHNQMGAFICNNCVEKL